MRVTCFKFLESAVVGDADFGTETVFTSRVAFELSVVLFVVTKQGGPNVANEALLKAGASPADGMVVTRGDSLLLFGRVVITLGGGAGALSTSNA